MISYKLIVGHEVNVRTDLGGIRRLIYRGCIPSKNGALRHLVARSSEPTAVTWSVPIERIAPLGCLPNGQPTEIERRRINDRIVRDKQTFATRFDHIMQNVL